MSGEVGARMDRPQQQVAPVFNVVDFGADPTGTQDSTAAIRAAVAAAAIIVGKVYLPPGQYLISNIINIGPYNITSTMPVAYPSFVGSAPPGRIGDAADNSAVALIASPTFPVGAPAVAVYAPNANVAPSGMEIGNLAVYCNSRSSGVYIEQPRMFESHDITVIKSVGPAGNPNGATGGYSVVQRSGTASAYNRHVRILTTDCAMDGFNLLTASNDVVDACYDLNAVRISFNISGFVRMTNCHYEGSGVGWQAISAYGIVRISGFDYFGLPSGNAIRILQGGGGNNPTIISDSRFANNPPTGQTEENASIVAVSKDQLIDAIFTGCVFTANTNTSDFVFVEPGTTGTVTFENCIFLGTPVVKAVNDNGTGILRFHNCPGINPGGFTARTTIPAIPASGTAVINPNSFDCTVYVTTSVASTISVDGSAVNTTLAGETVNVFVPAGSTITLTYTTAPTWKWYGH